ncbi:hypothetical protein [Acetobacter musti]|nr:hypothetical protein [Acetobacter musti]
MARGLREATTWDKKVHDWFHCGMFRVVPGGIANIDVARRRLTVR